MDENKESKRLRACQLLKDIAINLVKDNNMFCNFDPTKDVDKLLEGYELNKNERGIYSNYICDLVDFHNKCEKNILNDVNLEIKKNRVKVNLAGYLGFSLAGVGVGYLIDRNNGILLGFIAGNIARFFLSNRLYGLIADRYYEKNVNLRSGQIIDERNKLNDRVLEKLLID